MKILLLVMGLADINAMVMLAAAGFGAHAPIHIVIFTAVCSFAKALISIKDIGSAIDFGVVLLLFLSVFITIPAWILFIWAFFVGVKGIRSFGV